ncbi:MAG: type I-E CRISPR-associated protein Cse2/CasB [Chloroflexota bacterium]
MTEQTIHHFVDHLYSLAKSENRGALAALRRGLGQPPGSVAEMYRYIVPHLPTARNQEIACYLIAPLFALHPKPGGVGNFGAHMRKCDPDGKSSDALERRFTALLSAHPDDLPGYLRQSVTFLKSKEIPVNWNQLFWDLQNWDDEDRRVQKKWASAFWRRSQPVEELAK